MRGELMQRHLEWRAITRRIGQPLREAISLRGDVKDQHPAGEVVHDDVGKVPQFTAFRGRRGAPVGNKRVGSEFGLTVEISRNGTKKRLSAGIRKRGRLAGISGVGPAEPHCWRVGATGDWARWGWQGATEVLSFLRPGMRATRTEAPRA